jgi:phosphate-selective porin OprO/OprP
LAAPEKDRSAYDGVWAKTRLYSGTGDSFFQTFDLSGRLQLDWAYVDSSEDSHGEFNVRRFRFGFKTVFLQNWTLHLEGEFNPQEAEPFYTRLTDAYLAWRPSDGLALTAGKQSAGFTLDGMTSSKELLAIDRSNLTNNIWFTEEYIPGVSGTGEKGAWSYFVGIFTSDSEDPEFGAFKGGEFELVTLGYDFATASGTRQALWRINLLHNEPDPENTLSRELEWIASSSFAWEGPAWGLRADLSAAQGYGDQSDLAGFMLMPFFSRSDALQLVARYTFVESAEVNGVRFARYEREIAAGRGDRYNEIYLGLNYYWYGHKLKLQAGLQYADMRDEAGDGGEYSGWGATTAFRLSW